MIPHFFLFLFLTASQNLPTTEKIFIPTTPKGQLVNHRYYSLSYVEPFEQAEWTYYVYSLENKYGSTKRSNRFKNDPKIISESASPNDYKGSGYDRGHLIPAGDMKMNDVAMNQSFYMSNMSPQTPSFNRGKWKTLENKIRQWGSWQTLHILTGGILHAQLPTLGANGVAIPEYFYKVVFAPEIPSMIAFLMPNQQITLPLQHFVVSVDSIETLTEIDFFPQLNDTLEFRLESTSDIQNWEF